MFGKILYISDNIAYVENKINNNSNTDLLNIHVVFESDNSKILGEIVEVKEDKIQVKFLGEFVNNTYHNGLLRKAKLNSTIRIINVSELTILLGSEVKENILLGKSATYRNFNIYPRINDLFANHMCIFGNSGSGKSCGVARIVQNILSNKNIFSYNANLIFFDSFGEYKNAFKTINTINPNYNYKFITSRKKDSTDLDIKIPLNLLDVDDYAILLQADKHSELTILERALKYARIFSLNDEETNKYKNNIIAKAMLTILYNNNTSSQKKDDIYSILDICHTKEFNFDTVINGVGVTRSLSECFTIDSKGRFGEEVLITEYILKYIDDNISDDFDLSKSIYTLQDFAKALDFTLISDGFNDNTLMHDDAQLLKVRLHTILHNEICDMFTGDTYKSINDFVKELITINGKKAQVINISLEGIDDAYAKSLVKIYSRLLFEFSKEYSLRNSMPFHLFLEEAHRYIQSDNDTYLLGYNIFDRIAKEGRKYGVLLNIISQRPVDLSDTVISQCSNFIIFKMTHPKDIKYIEEMLPNISSDVIDKMKVLQPGSAVVFGSAFKIPMLVMMDLPNPLPYSTSCDVMNVWDYKSNL